MELIALQCKNCGGEITIEDDKKIVYCPYCGTLNYIDDGTRTVKIVDEAKLEEVRLRQEEFLKRKASEEELNGIRDKKIKQRRIWRVFMVLAHILIVIPIFLLMKNMDDTPSINLILGMLGYLLIMPIIMGVTRPSIPSKKWDVKEKSKGKLILLFYISFAAVLLVAVMAGVAIFAMN